MRASGPKARAAKLAMLKNPTWRVCCQCEVAKPPADFVGTYKQNGTLERKSCAACRALALEYKRLRDVRMRANAAESVRRLSSGMRFTFKIGDEPEQTLHVEDFNYKFVGEE